MGKFATGFKALASLFAVGLCLAGASTGAKADIVYVLSGVQFDDGGTLTGSFTLNTYGYLESYNLTSTMGTTINGYSYQSPGPVSGGSSRIPRPAVEFFCSQILIRINPPCGLRSSSHLAPLEWIRFSRDHRQRVRRGNARGPIAANLPDRIQISTAMAVVPFGVRPGSSPRASPQPYQRRPRGQ